MIPDSQNFNFKNKGKNKFKNASYFYKDNQSLTKGKKQKGKK